MSHTGHRLRRAWQEKGDETVIVDDDGAWSGWRLLERSAILADSLAKEAVFEGEPVAVWVSNRAADYSAILAVWSVGGVVVPIHRTSPRAVIDPILAATGARFLLDGQLGAESAAGAEVTPLRQHPGLQLRDVRLPSPDPLLADAALVVFTSGSTGLPKGVVLSHRALAVKLANNGALLGFDPTARTQLVLQITFSFGLWVSLLTLISGGVLAIRSRFDVATVLADLAFGGITRTALVPTMLRAIEAQHDQPRVVAALSAIRAHGRLQHIYTGGEILTGVLADQVRHMFGQATLFNIFGLTETATSDFFLAGEELANHPGAIGCAAPGVDYRIVGSDGGGLSPGEVGELQIRTETIMTGYLGQPKATADSFADGYFRTGDLARVDGKGIVSVVGRIKDVISRGGNKIYPQEVELAVQSHPAIALALATGVTDAVMGERIHVAVQLKKGHEVSVGELKAWAGQRLDKFKIPDAFHVLDELPTGRTGKADRGQLKMILSSRPVAVGA